MKENVVYWIRHKDHTDIKTQGYVGVTTNFKRRMAAHEHNARRGSSLPVHRAMVKYGDHIIKEIVASGDQEFCYFVEAMLRFDTEIGWNLIIGGEVPTMTGLRVSEETRAKQSAAHKGRRFTAEHRCRIGDAHRGKALSEQTKNLIREKATGRVKSDESKRKFSDAMSGRNLWENSAARKDLWAIADKFYAMFLEDKKVAAKKMANKLGFYNCNPWKIKDQFVKGWNPLEDEQWLSFKAAYQKEAHGTQPI